MNDFFPLTIEDVLKRKHFEHTRVIAGNDGFDRLVKWVHIVEVTNIRKLLNGNELILTTGVSWNENPDVCLSFVQQLVESNASGLCIEMGTYTSTVPPTMIEYADKHDFPIILFEKEVPFVEITQDIHSFLISQQYKMISDLENYSQLLNKKVLTIEHYHEILQFLHKTLGKQVLFRFHEQEIESIPKCTNEEKNALFLLLQQKGYSNTVAKVPVVLLGNEYAEIIIISDHPLSEFDHLLLDRTATAIAQHLLRDLYVEEKKRVHHSEWVHDWLTGQHTNESVLEYLIEHDVEKKVNGGVVCTCKFNNKKSDSTLDGTYLKLLFRTIFEQQGFTSFVTEKRNELVFILLNNRTTQNWKERLNIGLERIKASDLFKKKYASHINIGVGKFVKQLSNINNSYETAEETIRIQQKMKVEKPHLYYEDLHLFRLISIINKQVDLREYVLEYLLPVLEYDERYNGKLLETLRVYLMCNGSKQETAKRLFVVRQTLYHRIEKLEKLLGDDFMTSEKRVAIEFMLLTYDYLLPTKQTDYKVKS